MKDKQPFLRSSLSFACFRFSKASTRRVHPVTAIDPSRSKDFLVTGLQIAKADVQSSRTDMTTNEAGTGTKRSSQAVRDRPIGARQNDHRPQSGHERSQCVSG